MIFVTWVYIRFFKECPHPDDKQRKELSRELGLEPLQVKFWFQNKRTQMKVTHIIYIKYKFSNFLCDSQCIFNVGVCKKLIRTPPSN